MVGIQVVWRESGVSEWLYSGSNWWIAGEWTLVTLLLSPDHCTPVE